MLWLVVVLALAIATAVAAWCALAAAEVVYGHPIGRGLIRRISAMRVERRFLRSDIREIDEAFVRLAHSDVTDD